METRKLIAALAALLVTASLAWPQASVRVENSTGAVNYPTNFTAANSGTAGFLAATSGTAVNPTISGTMTGNFARSGTTTGGTISALTLTGTTSGSTLIISGSVALNGNTTLGDASGDTLTINAGTVTAPNASGTSSTSIANIATTDARYPVIYNSRLASDFTVTSSTTFVDSGITVTVPAGTYLIMTSVVGTAADSTGGSKSQIVSTSTMTVAVSRLEVRNGTTVTAVTDFGNYTTLGNGNTASALQYVNQETRGTITVAATATIKIQYAQFTSSATASLAKKGSYLVLWKLP